MKRRALKILLCLILLAAGAVGLSALRGRYGLTVSRYTLKTEKVTAPLRVVQLSDLHNREFGKNNERLLEKVAGLDPDLILFTGDLVTCHDPERAVGLSLLEELCAIAPVYASMGNHDLEYARVHGVDLERLIENTGAVLLEREYEDVTIGGQELRLGGLYGYCLPEKYLATGEADREECAFLREMQDTSRMTLLMCHLQVCWLAHDGLNLWGLDCVYTGHAHGGQIRLPLLGGFYAPEQGYFPGRVWGTYEADQGGRYLVLSRGLGNNAPLPRLFNPPEIVVTELVPAS